MSAENLRVKILLCALVCEQDGMTADNEYQKAKGEYPNYNALHFGYIKDQMIELLEQLK